MTAAIAFTVCAVLFICAIVLLRHLFVKSANGESCIISRIALGTCLAACFAVIGVVPLIL